MSWIRMHHSIVLEPRSPVSFPHGALPRDRQTRHAPTRRRKSDDSGTTGSDAPGLGRKHPWALPRKKGTPLKGVGTGKRCPIFSGSVPGKSARADPGTCESAQHAENRPKTLLFRRQKFPFFIFPLPAKFSASKFCDFSLGPRFSQIFHGAGLASPGPGCLRLCLTLLLCLMSGQVRSGQDRSGLANAGQVMTGQIKSGQLKLSPQILNLQL